MRLIFLIFAPLALNGCIAQTALDVATLPVKAATKTMDVLTTSQAEADQKRGREMREYEECLGREQRRAEKAGRAVDPDRCSD